MMTEALVCKQIERLDVYLHSELAKQLLPNQLRLIKGPGAADTGACWVYVHDDPHSTSQIQLRIGAPPPTWLTDVQYLRATLADKADEDYCWLLTAQVNLFYADEESIGWELVQFELNRHWRLDAYPN